VDGDEEKYKGRFHLGGCGGFEVESDASEKDDWSPNEWKYKKIQNYKSKSPKKLE
jgi:hypothetical protein